MKLWHVVQWGNKEEGPNGWDTQCIVSAPNLASAVAKGELHIESYNGKEYRNGKVHAVYLLGQDDRPDGEAVLITTVWVKPGVNLGRNPMWLRRYRDNDEWEKQVID